MTSRCFSNCASKVWTLQKLLLIALNFGRGVHFLIWKGTRKNWKWKEYLE
jgi:hypothetical protein